MDGAWLAGLRQNIVDPRKYRRACVERQPFLFGKSERRGIEFALSKEFRSRMGQKALEGSPGFGVIGKCVFSIDFACFDQLSLYLLYRGSDRRRARVASI